MGWGSYKDLIAREEPFPPIPDTQLDRERDFDSCVEKLLHLSIVLEPMGGPGWDGVINCRRGV